MSKDSASKRKEDIPVELESQFILRLPINAAQALRASVRSGNMNLKDRLSIELQHDNRHGTVRFDNWVFSAKVVDLPCIIESQKTIDRKTFYKTADICQMMICTDGDDNKSDEEETPKKKDKDRKFLWNHGITPPLKNVRKRRFRKTLKKKYVEAPDVEKEVKRLFRVDNEAVQVKWEVVTDEEKSETKNPMEETSNTASPSTAHHHHNSNLDVVEHDIFGEVVSSSEDEEDVNIMDSGDDENSRLPDMLDQGLDMNISDEQNEGDHRTLLQARLIELENQLEDTRDRRQAQQLEISSIENQALRDRLKGVLDRLLQEEDEKQKEYNEILSAL